MTVLELQMWIGLFLSIAAAVTVVYGLLRWFDRKLESRIVKEIREATYQIQPGTNGGSSLQDLHDKVDCISQDISVLRVAVLQLEDDVSHIEEDLEDLH
jgi:hypothetical protein